MTDQRNEAGTRTWPATATDSTATDGTVTTTTGTEGAATEGIGDGSSATRSPADPLRSDMPMVSTDGAASEPVSADGGAPAAPAGTGAGQSEAPRTVIGAQDSSTINANLAGLAAGTVTLAS